MRITVCELPDDRREFASQWQALGEHVRHTGSEWVLLPDMPFCRWPRDSGGWHKDAWSDCVRAHDRIESKLRDLAPAHVLGSRPIDFGNERYVEAFIWDREQGLRSSHAQCGAGDTGLGASPVGPEFTPFDVRGARFYLEVAGMTGSGAEDGSPGQVASAIYSSDTIFADGFE